MTKDHPIPAIHELWLQRNAWAKTARDGKATQQRSRKLALWLAVSGASLGSMAPLEVFDSISKLLGAVSVLLIGLGGYIGRELLTPERETNWAKGRILTEALKRECWLCLMKVPPYDKNDSQNKLLERGIELLENTGLERVDIDESAESGVPTDYSIEGYINNRVLEQAGWYEKKSKEHRKESKRIKQYTFLIGVISLVLGVLGAYYEPALSFIPVATTATAALVAWIQASRISALISIYQGAATQLRFQIAKWEGQATLTEEYSAGEKQKEITQLVERCETVMAQENNSWKAEWLSKEKVRRVIDEMKKLG